MSRTLSTMVELGSAAPAFHLPDVITGQTIYLADFVQSGGLLVMFLCQHCPYVKHVEQELARIGKDYANSGLAIVAISSNDAAAYPDDAPEALAEQARRLGFAFPYLYDETQEVARAYNAACTPDFFLFDKQQRLVYRGQLDDSRPRRGDSGNDIPVTGKDLRAAIDAVLARQPVSTEQRPSLGCNIKWKEPAY